MEAIGLRTGEQLVLHGDDAQNATAIIEKLCGLAQKAGYVDETFASSLLSREEEYPTGLPTEVPIAMPHVREGCLQTFCAVATLKEPVEFGCMGDPDTKLQIRHIFLFGITDPSQQTKVLRRFSAAFQDSDFLNSCLGCTGHDALVALLKDKLGDCLLFDET